MSHVYTYELQLTFCGPLISQAAGTLSFGVDSAMLRDDQGKPALNGSLVRGNIREAMLLFAAELEVMGNHKISQKTVHDWFGRGSSNDLNEDKGFEPGTAKVAFDFLWRLSAGSEHKDDQYRSRISIEAETGKVKQGHLQVIEDCFPPGSQPVFNGYVRAVLGNEQEADKFQRLLEMALDYIPAMGSFKGIGFGRLKEFKVLPLATADCAEQGSVDDQLSGDEVHIGFAFTPDRAFCLGKPRLPDSNRIVSDDIISGNVIKALLANAIEQEKGKPIEQEGKKPDDLQFDRWQISHCLPVHHSIRERLHRIIPLSVAITGKNKDKKPLFQDLCRISLQDAVQQPWETAPKFQPDWKGKDDYWKAINYPIPACDDGQQAPDSPKRRLQVRTAIKSETQTAEESQLFSMECVVPDHFVWRGNINLQDVDDSKRADALRAIRAVAGKLSGLGKTKANLTQVALYPQAFSKPEGSDTQVSVTQGDQVVLTLLTAARLFERGWERKDAAQTAEHLYQHYWREVSEGSLDLHNFFAQQHMQGGAYHYHRFQSKDGCLDYMPEWLTNAGSVFVLKVNDKEKAQQFLNDWLQQGLPVPEGDSITWEDSPYLPEHGFGEIAVNWFPLDENKE